MPNFCNRIFCSLKIALQVVLNLVLNCEVNTIKVCEAGVYFADILNRHCCHSNDLCFTLIIQQFLGTPDNKLKAILASEFVV